MTITAPSSDVFKSVLGFRKGFSLIIMLQTSSKLTYKYRVVIHCCNSCNNFLIYVIQDYDHGRNVGVTNQMVVTTIPQIWEECCCIKSQTIVLHAKLRRKLPGESLQWRVYIILQSSHCHPINNNSNKHHFPFLPHPTCKIYIAHIWKMCFRTSRFHRSKKTLLK